MTGGSKSPGTEKRQIQRFDWSRPVREIEALFREENSGQPVPFRQS
jgi:hypothetical protein